MIFVIKRLMKSGSISALELMLVLNGNLAKNGELHTCTVKNANYRKVIAVLEKFMQDDRYEFCHCERCTCEIAALSLNYLPPHYYVDPGRDDGIGSPGPDGRDRCY